MSDTDSPEPGSAPTNPFVPRYREPWVNPAKKGAALAIAAAAAVVLLAVGVLVGLGLGGHGHHGPRHDLRMVLRHPGRFGPPARLDRLPPARRPRRSRGVGAAAAVAAGARRRCRPPHTADPRRPNAARSG